MIIKNFDQLASSPDRKTALTIIESGYESIITPNVITHNVSLQGSSLRVQNDTYDLHQFEHVYLVAIGKCALAATQTLEKLLGDRLTKSYCLDIRQGELKYGESFLGTHPLPSQANVDATQKIMQLLRDATERDLILTVVSGGGSALLSAPYKIDFQTKALISNELMKAGADIHELNIVRKHISEIKGGRYAALAYPATVVSLIFSDVPGNDLATIASGIAVKDNTTNEDAKKVLEQFDIYNRAGLTSIELNETPKEDKNFEKVHNYIVVDSKTVLTAMEKKTIELGLKPFVVSDHLTGEADEVGTQLLQVGKPGEVVLAAGETTVHVKGSGVGGRNQELVLHALDKIKPGQVLVSVGSDGHDHSDLAGAIGDETSDEKAMEKGLNPQQYLENSASYTFFTLLGDGIDTGLLDSNVADFMLVLNSAKDTE